MKNEYLVKIGVVGSGVSWFFSLMGVPKKVLLGCMILDFVTGLIVAGYFKNSPKTDTGSLSSKIGYKGLCKKGLILCFVLVGVMLDSLLNVDYISNGVCFAFIVNEIISMTENATLMGIGIPTVITNALDIIKSKENK